MPAISAKVFGPRDLRLVETDLGPLLDGKVRIHLRAGGICGSDMHYFMHARNGDFSITEPLTLGHEIAGVIGEVGAGVTGFALGDHVAVNPARWCGSCPECRRGDINFCTTSYFMGSASRRPHMQGGFASVFDVEAKQCIVVPADRPMQHIALAEPLSVCLHAVSRADDVAGCDVAVAGCGPIGLLIAMVARHRGAARVTIVDIVAQPLLRASSLGFETLQLLGPVEEELLNRFDVVFEASGAAPALYNALKMVRRGGMIVQVGNFSVPTLALPSNLLMSKQIDWRGSFRFGDVFDEAVRMIVDGLIDVAPLISASLPLVDAAAAFDLALDRSRSMKVMLVS